MGNNESPVHLSRICNSRQIQYLKIQGSWGRQWRDNCLYAYTKVSTRTHSMNRFINLSLSCWLSFSNRPTASVKLLFRSVQLNQKKVKWIQPATVMLITCHTESCVEYCRWPQARHSEITVACLGFSLLPTSVPDIILRLVEIKGSLYKAELAVAVHRFN